MYRGGVPDVKERKSKPGIWNFPTVNYSFYFLRKKSLTGTKSPLAQGNEF